MLHVSTLCNISNVVSPRTCCKLAGTAGSSGMSDQRSSCAQDFAGVGYVVSQLSNYETRAAVYDAMLSNAVGSAHGIMFGACFSCARTLNTTQLGLQLKPVAIHECAVDTKFLAIVVALDVCQRNLAQGQDVGAARKSTGGPDLRRCSAEAA